LYRSLIGGADWLCYMGLFLRFLQIVGAYLAAAYIATLTFLAVGIMMSAGEVTVREPLGDAVALTLLFAAIGLVLTLPLTFLPVLGLVIAAEIFRWQQLWLHLGFGGVLGAFVHTVLAPNGSMVDEVSIRGLVIGGAAGGLVYWLIAGRSAGVWRDRKIATARA
jgi:hypothetical protein